MRRTYKCLVIEGFTSFIDKVTVDDIDPIRNIKNELVKYNISQNQKELPHRRLLRIRTA
jgi:hypothetical protein